jgi:purine nucleosidase
VVEGGGVPQKIVVDCDPGDDDAFALLLAHGSPAVELCAITTVMGDSTLADVSHTALAVAALAGIKDVPIAAGCDRPLLGASPGTPAPHTEATLDPGTHARIGASPTGTLDPRHAVDVIIETVMGEAPGTVTLVPTAALTNIALAVRKEPRIVERVAEVVLVGGVVIGGDRTAAGGSDIMTDPEAAHIVLGEPWPVTMVGLDLTRQALATPEVVDRIAALDTAPARFVLEALEFFGGLAGEQGGPLHPPLHDLCAVARVIEPSVVTTRRAPIRVELTGRFTRGMTVTDLRGPARPDCHTRVAVSLDHTRFWDLVVDALTRIGQP